jgi:hypothetical protein
MEPLTNTAMVLPRDIYNVTSYYLECQGQNPLSFYLTDAYAFVNGYNETITTLLLTPGGCKGNPGLQASISELAVMNNTLNDISAEIACPPIQSQLSDVLETGLCTQFFQGIYTIWLGMYITISCLFVASIMVSLIYQYFGEFWGDIRMTSVDQQNSPPYAPEASHEDHPAQESPNEFYYNTSSAYSDKNL